jgi:predicted nucleotidyltransferase
MKSLDAAPLTDNERAAVREAARILKERFPVEEIVLFGSKARGDFDAESDIDLLVLTSREVHWQERHAMIDSIYELELDRDVFMSLLILPRQDWKTGDYTVLPIHREIDRDGISV